MIDKQTEFKLQLLIVENNNSKVTGKHQTLENLETTNERAAAPRWQRRARELICSVMDCTACVLPSYDRLVLVTLIMPLIKCM